MRAHAEILDRNVVISLRSICSEVIVGLDIECSSNDLPDEVRDLTSYIGSFFVRCIGHLCELVSYELCDAGLNEISLSHDLTDHLGALNALEVHIQVSSSNVSTSSSLLERLHVFFTCRFSKVACRILAHIWNIHVVVGNALAILDHLNVRFHWRIDHVYVVRTISQFQVSDLAM